MLRKAWVFGMALLVLAEFPSVTRAQVGQNVILLHGIRQNDGAKAWDNTAVKNAIVDNFAPLIVDEPTTGWKDPLSDQAGVVRTTLTTGAPRDNVTAVGYSLGGVVAREYAKEYNSSSYPRLSTIITLDSPLAGATILNHLVRGGLGVAANLFVLSAALLTEGYVVVDVSTGTPYYYTPPGWEWEGYVAAAIGIGVGSAVWEVGQAESSDDYRPNSTLIQSHNSNPCAEANINRASIIGVEHDPEIYRLGASAFGDGTCIGDQGFLGAVDFIKDICTAHETDAIINYLDTNDDYWLYEAAYWEAVRDYITHFPKFWRDKVIESSSSDGIVPASSETYPNQPDGQFKVAVDCVNHLDTQNSSAVAARVVQFMQLMAANPLPLAPVPPASLSLAGNSICSGGGATLAWCANNNSESYDVELFPNATLTPPAITTVTGVTTPFQDVSGLSPGITYSWHVRGRNRDGPGDWSSPATFTATGPPALAVTWDTSASVYWGETQWAHLSVTNSNCPTTYQWVLLNPHSDNYATYGSGNSAYAINDIVYSNSSLDYEVTATNAGGSTTIYVTFYLYATSRPPDGGCPYVAAWNGSGFEDENNILPQSEDPGRAGERVVDRYLMSQSPQALDGEYRIRIREFENERSELDHLQLMAVDYPLGSEVATDAEGALHSFVPLRPATGTLRSQRQATTTSSTTWPIAAGDVVQLNPDATIATGDEAPNGMVIKGEAALKPPVGTVNAGVDPGAGSVRLRQRTSEVYVPVAAGAGKPVEFIAAGAGALEGATWVHETAPLFHVTELPLLDARGSSGDCLSAVSAEGGGFAELIPGGLVDLRFQATPVHEGMQRRLLLVSTGRYARVDAGGSATATRPILEPGLSVRYGGDNRAVSLDFTLDHAGPVRLVLFDIQGREVSTLFDGVRPAGHGEVRVNADALGNGVYFARLTAGGARTFERTQKFVIVH